MERYEEYKDSGVEWIDQYPCEWKLVNLSSLVDQRRVKNSDLQEQNVLSLSYGRIKRRQMDNSGLLPDSFDTYNVIQKGDIVLRLTDLQNDQVSLRVGRSNEKGIITSAYTTLVPRIDSRYLFYELAAFDYWKGFYGLAGGVRQSLNYDGIKNLQFLLASEGEQRSIADYLDAKTTEIDSLIEKTEKSIELLEEYRKSVISEAVTKGLDPNVPMKDSGIEWIGEIPAHWEIAKSTHIGSSVLGRMLDKNNAIGNNMYPYLTNKDVQWFSINTENLNSMDFPDDPVGRYGIVDGDILICEGGEVGRCAVWRGDSPNFFFQKAIHRFRIDQKKAYPEFIAYQLYQKATSTNFVEVRKGESTIAHLPGDQLSQLRYLLPPIEEQKMIVLQIDRTIRSINAQIESKKTLSSLLHEYRKSLISEAVTGKFKVPGVE